MTARTLLMSKAPAAGGGPTFFGYYAMFREVWAEDPDWVDNPGDGNPLTTVRNNGTFGGEMPAAGTNVPTYLASGIGGRPVFEFTAPTTTSGGHIRSDSGGVPGGFSLVVVGQFDDGLSRYLTDARFNNSKRAIIGSIGGKWRGYNTSSYFSDDGVADTDPHLFVLVVNPLDDLELFVDGVSVASDTTGTASDVSGLVLGNNTSLDNQALDGRIAYAAQFAGDITAQAGYTAWVTDIEGHYGL